MTFLKQLWCGLRGHKYWEYFTVNKLIRNQFIGELPGYKDGDKICVSNGYCKRCNKRGKYGNK